MKKDGFKHHARARADGNKARSIWNALGSSATAPTHRSSRMYARTLAYMHEEKQALSWEERRDTKKEGECEDRREGNPGHGGNERIRGVRAPAENNEKERKRQGCSRVRYVLVHLPAPPTLRPNSNERVTGPYTSRTKRAQHTRILYARGCTRDSGGRSTSVICRYSSVLMNPAAPQTLAVVRGTGVQVLCGVRIAIPLHRARLQIRFFGVGRPVVATKSTFLTIIFPYNHFP